MRAFFGLSPNAKTKLAIDEWRNNAFSHLDHPVPVANFHVTLAFLGHVSPKQLDTIHQLVEHLPSLPSFSILLNQLGYWAKPKALWLGCQHTAIEHTTLSKQLHKIANKSGVEMQKQDYIAHLTLARKCKLNPPAPIVAPNFLWHADQFHLFESVSSPQGVSYPIRHSWPIKRNDTE